ncbi:hypothetical protein ACIBIZ_21375 [Nonomuraea spiralis]|uniref:hypothetical protein n=1 Tax=Nonomuraea TaxID=83681 RepID=UPI000F7A5198|nr:hypothetical protein [Nonomuraea sp. WAC 01424]RSN06477.1 hypothetical protein DMB42_24630 [Nonomuraea sp. WAC 01424]
MTISKAVHVAAGLFLTGVGSLILLTFSSLAIGVPVGFLLVCVILLSAGLVGLLRSQYKDFFAGWLLWTATLATYTGVVLF